MATASAVNLGVQGQTFPIEEVDMRALLAESLAKVDLGKINSELTDSANTFFERLPPNGLPRAEATQTRWVDPSIELTSDIKAPVKTAAGEWEWTVMHPAGTRVNPLDTVQPVDRMLFFNAAIPEEVEFVKKVVRARPLDVMPVATEGNIKPLFEAMKRPVFYANATILTRFAVQATPTLVGVGQGVLSRYLAVTEIKLPAKPALVTQAWYGLPEKQVAGDAGSTKSKRKPR